jgi:excisionase family DNA binding protein
MTYLKDSFPELLLPSDVDTEEAKLSSRVLSPRVERHRSLSLRLIDEDSRKEETVITLPAKVARVLLDILVQTAEGKAVTIIPTHAELTTQQAADVLNVSRPFLVQLLEKGKIPFRKVGTHRRVLLSDVLSYKQQTDSARKQALDELAALSQELGLD